MVQCRGGDSWEENEGWFPFLTYIRFIKMLMVADQLSMVQDWLRFSVAFWHTFRGTGADPFGAPTKSWPWEDGTDSVAMAKRRSKTDSYCPLISDY